MALEGALAQGFKALELDVSEAQRAQLVRYADLLLAQNEHMNLTAITEPLDIAELHFLDCAALLTLDGGALFPDNGINLRLIDVGTGAGFPGVVLKILRPSLHVTLLDSQQKRIDWLETLCADLGLTGIAFVHGRGEVLGHDAAFREQFDLATARAVAPLPLLSELCLPFVKTGGRFLAMKGAKAQDELKDAAKSIRALGGGAETVYAYRLPQSSAPRALVSISKLAPTAGEYPRKWTKMKKAAQ